jgi:hypothetical protein
MQRWIKIAVPAGTSLGLRSSHVLCFGPTNTEKTLQNWCWYSVETPQVFKEIKLPNDASSWSDENWATFWELEHLAERHGTYMQRSSFSRGQLCKQVRW